MGNMRMDMRLDAIEDALGDVGWKLAQLCLRFMDAQTVQQITGLDVTQFWTPLDNLRDYARMSVTVVGGSTQKLTTQQKKQEAVQVGQVMAQYVRAAPASALKVSLDMLSKAFDDFMISKEDWDSIEQEVAQMAQSQQGGAPGQPGGGVQVHRRQCKGALRKVVLRPVHRRQVVVCKLQQQSCRRCNSYHHLFCKPSVMHCAGCATAADIPTDATGTG